MILGIVGFLGSGKGTVGDFLSDFGFKQDSFAKPLKDCVSIIFGWDRELLEGITPDSRSWRNIPDKFWSEKLGREFTPRLALQLFGTEACRNSFGESIWIESLFQRIKDNRDTVITDTRFKNEFLSIQKAGGVIIRVKRGDDPIWFHHLSKLSDQYERERFMKIFDIHRSEWDWVGLKPDFTIENCGTLQDLKNSVESILDVLKMNRWRSNEINK